MLLSVGGGGGGGEQGAEGKGGDEAVVNSAEYLEVAAMATEPAFDVNTSTGCYLI